MAKLLKKVINKNSQRTRDWQKANPELYAIARQRQAVRKRLRQEEMVAALAKAKYKTPVSAIAAYCRFTCEHSAVKSELKRAMTTIGIEITCKKTKCQLYPFKNGDPKRVLISRKLNNVRKQKEDANG